MTVTEFKEQHPDLAHLEGNDLLNAMEDSFIRQQRGQEVIKHIVPFFKRYQLRWLFYRKLPNWQFITKSYQSNTRCKVCKSASSMRWFWQGKMMCDSLNHEYQEEPNTSFKHRMYVVWKWIKDLFWFSLNKIHLVRSGHEDRYGMFGDEAKYVHSWMCDMDTRKMTPKFKKRKWWEYIFIERKTFNF